MRGVRNLLLMIGIPILVVALGWAAIGVTTQVARNEKTVEESFPANVERIDVEAKGALKIAAVDGEEIRTSWRLRWSLSTPSVSSSVSGDTLVLRVECPWLAASSCDSDLDLELPPGIAVVASTRDGEVAVTGLDSGLDLAARDGTVKIDNVRGALRIDLRDGDLRAAGIRSDDAEVLAQNGAVTLAFAAAPTDVRVESQDGPVRLTVPDGSGPYRVNVDIRDGTNDIGIANDAGSSRSIDVQGRSADVHLGYE